MSQTNSLEKYYRQVKTYVTLPSSKGEYVNGSAVQYTNDNKEIGVKPLAAHDEVMLKNPDALLNGEAVASAIRSCVTNVTDPMSLPINDINFLLAVIKKVSAKEHDIELACPLCSHVNLYSLNLENIVDNVDYLDESYPVNLDSGVTIFVSPYSYKASLKSNSIAFEEARFVQRLQSPTGLDREEEERIKELSHIILKISELNVDMVTDSIMAVVNDQDEINVTDKTEIRLFIQNIESEDAKKISNEISRISRIGLPQTVDMQCQAGSCGKVWEAPLSFDPTTFFTVI